MGIRIGNTTGGVALSVSQLQGTYGILGNLREVY